MTIDWTKPLESSDGYPAILVRLGYRYRHGKEFSNLVVIQRTDHDYVYAVNDDGRSFDSYTIIRNKKVKRKGWINLYPHGQCASPIYSKEKDAIESRASNFIATIRIEWEE